MSQKMEVTFFFKHYATIIAMIQNTIKQVTVKIEQTLAATALSSILTVTCLIVF